MAGLYIWWNGIVFFIKSWNHNGCNGCLNTKFFWSVFEQFLGSDDNRNKYYFSSGKSFVIYKQTYKTLLNPTAEYFTSYLFQR